MRTGFIGAARGSPVREGETTWAQVYERRMRRFNLEVISFALIALVIFRHGVPALDHNVTLSTLRR